MDLSILQQSAFLRALGHAIVNSVWQSCILWIIYHIIFSFLRKNSAPLKNTISSALVFISGILFFISFAFILLHKENKEFLAPAYYPIGQFPHIQAGFSFAQVINYTGEFLPYLSVAYIFLLIFFTARLVKAYKYIQLISNRILLKEAPDLHLFATRVAAQMNINKKVSVWISEHIDVPSTIKFFKPLILIPVSSINNLSTYQLEAIILHELFHIRRNDYLINLVISILETLLFFNPFVMLLVRISKRERENCCDDFVLQYHYDPHAYANALFHLEQARIMSLKLAVGAVSGKQQLLMRIKRITSNTSVIRQFNYGQKLIALIAVTGLICSFACLIPKKTQTILPGKKHEIALEKKFPGNSFVPNKKDSKLKIERSLKKLFVENKSAELSTTYRKDALNNDGQDISAKSSTADLSFVFNYKKIRLPESIDLSGIPFLPKNFHVNLSNLNEAMLNKNLRLAYKQLNAVNWKKIKKEINQNIQQENLNMLSSERQSGIDFQKAALLLKLNRKQSDFNSVLTEQNLLQHKMDIALLNNGKVKLQQFAQSKLEQLQQTISNDESGDYIKNMLPSAIKIPGKKNIKITIKNILKPSVTLITDDNKLLQFSFEDKNSKDGQSLINIEFNK